MERQKTKSNPDLWSDILYLKKKAADNTEDASRENEENSHVFDGKWDQNANNANRKDVIKQIRKVMDEVSHHALKGR